MSEPIVWENIPRSQTDPTTIGEAMNEAVETHNADTEAHVGEDQSLESHRTNPIVDHPAESMPNDKFFINTRQFVAIVDPSTDEDFDTIPEGVQAAIEAGGGVVRISSGTHVLDTELLLPANVSLWGEPDHTTAISIDGADGGGIFFQRNFNESFFNWSLNNLVFVDYPPEVFSGYGSSFVNTKLSINNCIFLAGDNFGGNSNLFLEWSIPLEFRDCYIECGAWPFISYDGAASFKFFDSTIAQSPYDSFCCLIGSYGFPFEHEDVIIDGCFFNGSNSSSHVYFQDVALYGAVITNNIFNRPYLPFSYIQFSTISNNRFHFANNVPFSFLEFYNNIFSDNYITGTQSSGSGIEDSEGNIFASNYFPRPLIELNGQNIFSSNANDFDPWTVSFFGVPTSTQALSNATWTNITLGTEDFDTSNNFSGSAFTAPCDGLYSFSAGVAQSSSPSRSLAALTVNGTRVIRSNDTEGTAARYCTLSAILRLQRGDVVRLQGWRSPAGDTNNGSDGNMSYLAGHLISRQQFT